MQVSAPDFKVLNRREKGWVIVGKKQRAEGVQSTEKNQQERGFGGRGFEEVAEAQGDEDHAEPCPQEESEVRRAPAEEFPNPRGGQKISHIIDQHFNRSLFGRGVNHGEVVGDQVAQDGIAPVVIPVLEGVAADAREEEPEKSDK